MKINQFRLSNILAFAGLFIALTIPVSSVLGAVDPGKSQCVACHTDYWEEMQESVHSKSGVSCHQCHGGDPTQSDQALAKAPGTGYVEIPDKTQIAKTCGSCHANVEVMNFYDIRTDQLAQYRTSAHGKKLFNEGDNRVASCSDCHGYHDVVPVSDPASPVYPLNLPKTCNTCHGKERLMDAYGHPTDIFEKYKSSVHGKALYEKKDLSVANCAKCHGSHGATPPGVKEIGQTCGKCHVNEKKYFLESEHAHVTQEGAFSECVSCHGYHEVQPTGLHLYEKTCIQCHDAGSEAFQRGQKILDVLQKSGHELETTELLVHQAAIEGMFVEDEEAVVAEMKTKALAMEPAQHSLSLEKIAKSNEQIISKAEQVKASVKEKRKKIKWRKIALIFIWIFILIMVYALWAKYKQVSSSHKPED